MEIGSKIKSLRLKKGLTQEELGERTDLTKGHISQLERDLNSPSIETLFALLEVLGTTPKDFFDEPKKNVKVVYSTEDQTIYTDDEMKYSIRWLSSHDQMKMKWNLFILHFMHKVNSKSSSHLLQKRLFTS